MSRPRIVKQRKAKSQLKLMEETDLGKLENLQTRNNSREGSKKLKSYAKSGLTLTSGKLI